MVSIFGIIRQKTYLNSAVDLGLWSVDKKHPVFRHIWIWSELSTVDGPRTTAYSSKSTGRMVNVFWNHPSLDISNSAVDRRLWSVDKKPPVFRHIWICSELSTVDGPRTTAYSSKSTGRMENVFWNHPSLDISNSAVDRRLWAVD
jgi:hypothetical protein